MTTEVGKFILRCTTRNAYGESCDCEKIQRLIFCIILHVGAVATSRRAARSTWVRLTLDIDTVTTFVPFLERGALHHAVYRVRAPATAVVKTAVEKYLRKTVQVFTLAKNSIVFQTNESV